MTSELLTRFKIEFAEAHPKEFKAFLAQSTSDSAIKLREEALNFYLSHSIGDAPTFVAITKEVTAASGGYSPLLSWADKTELAIKHNGRATTTLEIVDFILINEPSLDREKVKTGVTVTLSRMKGKRFIQVDNNGRGYAYDLASATPPKPPAIIQPKLFTPFDSAKYDANMKWADKIKFYLTELGGKGTTREIVDRLKAHEPIVNKELRNKRIDSMTQILRQNAKEGGIFVREDGQNGAPHTYQLK
jgi:hypothetical protein